MGLFSSKNVVYVASVAYNMAGDETERLSVLKSTVSRHILLGEKKVSFGERFIDTQMNGPTMDQRNWFRWCKQKYDVGQVTGGVTQQQNVENAEVLPYLPTLADHMTVVDDAFIDANDITFWAQQYILLNRPDDYPTDWIAEYDLATNQMTITFEDLSSVTTAVTGYVVDTKYLVCYYKFVHDTTGAEVSRVYIYRIGSGNAALDALVSTEVPKSDFFPYIPLRLNNKPISHVDFEDDYAEIEKAYKKGTGSSLAELLENIEDNENIDDVDYAHLVFGVELTTKEKCGLRYLYEFFRGLIPEQLTTAAQFATFATGTAYRSEPASTILQLKGTHTLGSHIDNRLSWINIQESIVAGLGKVGAEVGDFWFEIGPGVSVPDYPVYREASSGTIYLAYWTGAYSVPHAILYWQDSATSYRKLDIHGMMHRNFVYKDKAVKLTTTEALTNVDGDGEGFIVPLHYPTLAKIPLFMSNQLALSNRHIIFNCYQVVKIRWYQRGIFKILISIVIGIVMAFIFPQGLGLLGTALSVGTSLGFTGLTAIIVGATVNALAAMVLLTVIEKASIAIFGEALGRLLGSLFSFFAFQFVQGWATGVPFTIDWGAMMRMDNLMKLLSSSIDAVSSWVQGEMVGIQDDMEKAGERYKDDWEELEKKALDLLGAGGGVIDPLMFTQTQSRFHPAESRDAFLQRTLMTGSDLIDLSISMIEDYVDLNLTLDKVTT